MKNSESTAELTSDLQTQPVVIRKVFICQNGDCTEKDRARVLYERLLELRAAAGLDDPDASGYFKCNLSGCLNVCRDGPILVIQPDQILYHCPTENDLDCIFVDHLLGGRPIPDLFTRRKDS